LREAIFFHMAIARNTYLIMLLFRYALRAALPPTRAVWKLSSHLPMSSAEMKSELEPCAANWLTT
jgi:hypothetical protein